jgi:hypothetical protein
MANSLARCSILLPTNSTTLTRCSPANNTGVKSIEIKWTIEMVKESCCGGKFKESPAVHGYSYKSVCPHIFRHSLFYVDIQAEHYAGLSVRVLLCTDIYKEP